MSLPKRIQRQRTKGWRMPEGAVYVGRPTKWGNPFFVGRTLYGEFNEHGFAIRVNTRQQAVELFRERCNWRTGTSPDSPSFAADLRGKDLACWCPLEDKHGNPVPCHADVLLEWANTESHE